MTIKVVQGEEGKGETEKASPRQSTFRLSGEGIKTDAMRN